MLEQIINNFYFSRLLYIIIITLIGLEVINNLKSKNKIDIKKYLNIKKINLSLLLKYLFLSFAVRIVLEQLVIYISLKPTNLQIPSNIYEIILEFIAICIFAPIFEEIIFRFGFYKKLNERLNVLVSILITAIIFAVIHMYNIDGIIILLGISLIWHYSFYKTNNLIYPILLHFFHNIYALGCDINNYSSYWYILLLINIVGYIILIVRKQKK